MVPLWASRGGADSSGIGATTGVTMAATVLAQLAMPWLLPRLSLRLLLALGAALLGLPTVLYPFSDGLGWVLAVSGARGLGFGVVAVAGSALAAALVPAHQRGRAVGRYGIAVGAPQVVLLPLGVWVAQHVGFTPVFVTTGLLSLLAVPLAWLLSGQVVQPEPEPTASEHAAVDPTLPVVGTAVPGRDEPSSALDPVGAPSPSRVRRLAPLLGPWLLMVAASCAFGGITSFLPLALGTGPSAPVALLALSTAIIIGRGLAGIRSDRHGTGGLLAGCVLGCAVGILGLALATGLGATAAGLLAVAAALLYGVSFGALQNDTLVVMFDRAGPRGQGTASTVWNTAFDTGTGLGAVAIGALAQGLGLRGAFLISAALVLLTVPQAVRERHLG